MNESGPIVLVRARHPVLLMNHGLKGTTPLDLELGSSFRTLVISGPNAGGKSVAMKCVGLLCLMAQSGLHVPAAEGTQLRMIDSLFVDIGDEQSIENDLSTFSSHLRQLKSILLGAHTGSLVLIDEIGSGTDPAEGGAIAAAVLAGLTRKGALTIATTHHSALKVFAHDTDFVENGAMEFDQATLTPTYRFRAGVPGSSYALEMAERLGIPDEQLVEARRLLGSQQVRLDSLIGNLEDALQQARKRLEEADRERVLLEAQKLSYEAQLSSLNRGLKETRKKAADEAAELLAKANAVIEQSVKSIRESHAEPEAVRNVRREVQVLRQEVAAKQKTFDAEAENVPVDEGVAPGDWVSIKGSTDAGEVEGISSDGKSATVVFGTLRMKVRVTDVRRSSGKPRRAMPTEERAEKPESVETEVDVRGMTGDEAIPIVDKFLDEAIMAGLRRVDIIHGKGTGALRKRVMEFLTSHPRVRSSRQGEWNEGGMGVTVVDLG